MISTNKYVRYVIFKIYISGPSTTALFTNMTEMYILKAPQYIILNKACLIRQSGMMETDHSGSLTVTIWGSCITQSYFLFLRMAFVQKVQSLASTHWIWSTQYLDPKLKKKITKLNALIVFKLILVLTFFYLEMQSTRTKIWNNKETSAHKVQISTYIKISDYESSCKRTDRPTTLKTCRIPIIAKHICLNNICIFQVQIQIKFPFKKGPPLVYPGVFT